MASTGQFMCYLLLYTPKPKEASSQTSTYISCLYKPPQFHKLQVQQIPSSSFCSPIITIILPTFKISQLAVCNRACWKGRAL